MGKKERYYVWILFILMIGLLTYRLGTLNPYVNVDEAAMGYTSWCMAHGGTDRYGYSFPVYLKNFYSGQSVAYMWFLLPWVKLFGLNLWTVRLPMALAYGFTFFIWHHLLRFTDSGTRVTGTILYVISPILIGMGRVGLDCNLMLPATIWMMDAILTAIQTEKGRYYFLSACLCGFTLYTYALSYLFLPVFLFIIFALLLKRKKISRKNALIVIFTLGIMAVPAILEVYTLYIRKTDWNLGSLQFIMMNRDTGKELTDLSLKNLPRFLSCLIATDYITWNFIGDFMVSVPFGRCYFNFYLISIPFFFFGIYKSEKEKREKTGEKEISLEELMILYFLCGFCLFGCMGYMRTYRINFLLPVSLFFIAKGVAAFCTTKQRKMIIGFWYILEFYLFIFLVFGLCVPEKLAHNYPSISTIPFSEELKFIEKKEECKGKKIYVAGSDFNWIYTAFSLGGIPQKEIAWIDDTTPRQSNIYEIRNVTTQKYEEIKEDEVYIIGKGYLNSYYKDINRDFTGFEKEEFPYYTVFWKGKEK